MPLLALSIDDLIIEDEPSFSSIELYPRLKAVLRSAGHRFYVPADGEPASWDRTVFLNLTYWGGPRSGDVLCDAHIPADVIAHTAWHHLAGEAIKNEAIKNEAIKNEAINNDNLGADEVPSAQGLLFGESIASAFDLYLVGHLLARAPQSDFIVSQMPIMAEAAENAGLSAREFSALMETVSRDPDRAFEDLRALLLDVTQALLRAEDAPAAQLVLEGFEGHRFHALLHHYQLSNWILYARAYSRISAGDDQRVAVLDAALRSAPSSLGWLATHWLG
jgi:hypothetical protein